MIYNLFNSYEVIVEKLPFELIVDNCNYYKA